MATTTHDAAGSDPILQLQANGAGTEKVTVKSDGKVGVGLTAPAAAAHVKSDGSSVDQLRLENSAAGGKVWAISGGIDSENDDLSVRNQTDSRTIGAFHDDSTNNIRSLRIGLHTGSQGGQEAIGAGQLTQLLGSGRDGNSVTMRLDHASNFGQFGVGFRNAADTGAYTAGYMTVRKVAGDKGSLALAVNDGAATSEVLFIKEDKKVGIGTTTQGRNWKLSATSR